MKQNHKKSGKGFYYLMVWGRRVCPFVPRLYFSRIHLRNNYLQYIKIMIWYNIVPSQPNSTLGGTIIRINHHHRTTPHQVPIHLKQPMKLNFSIQPHCNPTRQCMEDDLGLCKWKTTSIFSSNSRRPQISQMKDDLKFLK